MTKTHWSTVGGLLEALRLTFIEHQHAEKVLNNSLKANKKWGSKDRRFVATQFYEIVRWYRKILWAIDIPWKEDPLPQLTENQLIKILMFWLEYNDFETPQRLLDSNIELDFIKCMSKYENNAPLEVIQSIPDWLNNLGAKQYDDQWPKFIKALNVQASTYLRVNTLKTNSKELLQKLTAEEIEVVPLSSKSEYTLKLPTRKNVFITNSYKKGLFEIQDGGSQTIAPFCDPQPKMRVIDACAGAGGKALHLATLINNKGKLIALDIHEWKLKELRKRASRNSIDIIETREATPKNIKRLKDSADLLLLDVPCSGTGVLKRKADTKWKMNPQRIEELISIQKEILSNYSKMLKTGGVLVYATCSIFKSENQDQVQNFLSENPNWELIDEKNIFPHLEPFDGFYMAKLKKC